MKHEIEKTLQTIPVPQDISQAVHEGIAQAERNRITMTRSVKKIVAAAAALVLCVGIVGAAAFIGLKTENEVDLSYDDVSLSFMGFDYKTGEAIAIVEHNYSGKQEIVTLADYCMTDENGEKVEYDSVFNMCTYWADDNGDLHFALLPIGAYKVEADTIVGDNGEEIGGHWKCDFNFDEWPYDVYFDPTANYVGSVEDGTAYIAEDGDIELEFIKNADGDKELKITLDTSKAPFDTTVKITPENYVLFNEERVMYGGGMRNPFTTDDIMFSSFHSDDFSWGNLVIENGIMYVNSKEEDQGRRCSVKFYAFAIELADGTVIEIQGDWLVDFTV